MHRLALLIFIISLPSFGQDSGVAQKDPKIFFKIVAALDKSKSPELRTKKEDDGTTYHLRAVHYLGQLARDGKTYLVAQASFVRSSPPGQDIPPPRGHSFVVLLDESFQIIAQGRSDHSLLHMIGSKLMEVDTELADFASREPSVRFRGFVQINMPYPFSDRITEDEWNSKSPMLPMIDDKPQPAPEQPSHLHQTSPSAEK